MGAPIDLRRDNDITLTYHLAEQRDTPAALGLAAHGARRLLLAIGAVELAQAELDAVTVPTSTSELMQLTGMLALSRSLVTVTSSHPADADAALDHAGELAERTGEGTAYGLGFGPPTWACGAWRQRWKTATTSWPRRWPRA